MRVERLSDKTFDVIIILRFCSRYIIGNCIYCAFYSFSFIEKTIMLSKTYIINSLKLRKIVFIFILYSITLYYYC